MKRTVAALVVMILFCVTSPAGAIVNGKVALGSDFVVTLLPKGISGDGFCTGVYFSERVVVTAAHCVIKDQGKAPELRYSLDDFYVSQPGIDWKSSDSKGKSVRVLKIWTEPDYFNRWNPDMNQKETQINDVAFLYLAEPLNGKHIDRAANSNEIEEFKRGNGTAFHLGYGCSGGKDSSSLIYDGLPYRVDGIVGTTRMYPHYILSERFLEVNYPIGTSLCPGDSGSPLLMNKGDQVLYLGTIFAGGGWQNAFGNIYAAGGVGSVTVLWPFISKLDEQWSKFLAEEPKLLEAVTSRKEAEAKAAIDREKRIITAKDSGQFYREQSSCHSNNIFALLQSNKSGDWIDVASVEGWISLNDKCHQPWTIYRAEKGELLRWRLGDYSGDWKVFSDPIKETTSIREAEIAANQLKAKEEAEAKAARDKAAAEIQTLADARKALIDNLAAKLMALMIAKPDLKSVILKSQKSLNSIKVSSSANDDYALKQQLLPIEKQIQALERMTTITCTKGKVTKKVTAASPKCPAGYKKK